MKGEKSSKKCKKFPCKWCRKGYVNSKDLKNHTKIMHGLEPNNCVSCDKKFESISGLTVHMKRGCKGAKFNKGVKFSCKSCNKTYLQKGGLNYHNKTVHQDIKVEPSSNENISMVEVKHEKIDHNELAQIEINKTDDLNEDLINDSEFAKAELVLDKEGQKVQEISNQDETDEEFQHDTHVNEGDSDDHQTESLQDDLVYDQDTKDEGVNEKLDQKCKKESRMKVEKSPKIRKIFSCKWCNKSYAQTSNLKNHIEIVHELKPNNCVSCDKKFESISGLSAHMKSGCKGAKVIEGVKFSCKSCNKVYRQKVGLNYHNKTVHGDTKNKVDQDETNQNEHDQVESTQKEQVHEDSIQDSKEGMEKPDQKDEKVNMQKEAKKNWFMKLSFKIQKKARKNLTKKAIKTIKEVGMQKEANNFCCKSCGKCFTQKSSLKTHVKTVHKLFESESCSESFIQANVFKNHIKAMHKKVKLKTCDSCDKSFSTPIGLKLHKRTVHEKIRFDCNLCEKSFTQTTCLRIHKESIHEKIRINCDLCDQSFTQKGSLKNHKISVHQKIRFNCDFCEKSFTQSQNLKSHIKTIHNGNRFNCDSCDKSFSHSQSLRNHKMNAHNDTKIDLADINIPAKDQTVEEETVEDKSKLNDLLKFLKDMKTKVDKDRPMQEETKIKTEIKAEDINDQHDRDQNESRYLETTNNTEIKIETDQDETDDENNQDKDESISRQFFCDMCQKVFTQMYLLESHISMVHLKKFLSEASDDEKRTVT